MIIKKVLDAKRGKRGILDKFLVDEIGWITKNQAVSMAVKGELDAVVVKQKSKEPFIRSKPDKVKNNNFYSMTKDRRNIVQHVAVGFEGWNAPWEQEGGKEIPMTKKSSTVVRIMSSVKNRFKRKGESTKTKAYATDTDDDVKVMALDFIKKNVTKSAGKIIIYGYSWGGDTAVELAQDLQAHSYIVDLLVTVDAAIGPASRWTDRKIPQNVLRNLNYYTTTPKSTVFSQGGSNSAENPKKNYCYK